MRLSRWLLERICTRTATMKSVTSSDSIEELCGYLRDNPSNHCRVVQDCLKFIKLYGITHYVYSIQLGANRFRVLTSSEHKKKVSKTAKAGAANIAKSSLGTTSSWWHRSSSMNVQEIGNIHDGQVSRGAGGEAVIGFKLLPIHTLVASHSIHEVFMKGLQLYVTERTTETKGPFLICCGRERMRLYWSVDKLHQVTATPDKEIASKFSITPINDDSRPHEFMIEYHEEDSSCEQDSPPKDSSSEQEPRHKDSSSKREQFIKETHLAPLPHYLNGTASMFAYNKGPLEVKLNVTAGNTRFVLHSRVSDDYAPVNLNSWEHGEAFYINCSRRRFKREGYVSVKKNTKALEYITAIVPSEHYHNDFDTWLLFRLIPVKNRHKEDDRCVEGLTEQEEEAKLFEAITNASVLDLEHYK